MNTTHVTRTVMAVCMCTLLLPATAAAENILQAPNATFLLESEVLGGNQSNNLGPAAQWVLDNYWEEGACPEVDSFAYCDILRFGAAVFATSACAPGTDVVIEAQEEGGKLVKDFISSNDTSYLCDQAHYRPVADALYDLQEQSFPDLDANDDEQEKDSWFDHPHLTLAVIGGMPPQSQGDGDEVLRALYAACDVSEGIKGEVPPMPVWTMLARLHDDDAVGFAQLLSAAGQTGICCDTDVHGQDCNPIDADQRLDVCAHLDERSDHDMRADLADERYRCITAEDTWRTGALDFETTGNNLPQITCHLSGLGPGNAGNPNVCDSGGRVATDLLGAFACIRQIPRHLVGESADLHMCDAAGCQTLGEDDYVYIDENKTLISLAGEFCDSLASGTAQLEVDDCPMRGEPCDTGLLGRCKEGFYDCTDSGEVECTPLRGPMPEICNGRDDSCDGLIDNVDDTIHQLPEEKQGYACWGQRLCQCPEGAETQDYGQDLQSFVDGQEGKCRCSSTISPPEQESHSSADDDDEHTDGERSDHDGCSLTGDNSPTRGGWLLAIIIAIGALYRRQLPQSPN